MYLNIAALEVNIVEYTTTKIIQGNRIRYLDKITG